MKSAQILNDVSFGILFLDNDWNVTYRNQNAVEILKGYGPLTVGNSVLEIFGADAVFLREPLERANLTQEVQKFEMFFERCGLGYELKVYPSVDGYSIRFTQLESTGNLLSRATHDLYTPLTAIKIQIQSAESRIQQKRPDALDPERIEKLLRTTDRQIDQLTRIVDGLMYVTSLKDQAIVPAPEQVELGEVVRSVLQKFGETFQSRRNQVHSLIEEKVLGLWDRSLIEQAISAVFDYVYKAAHATSLTVRVGQDERTSWFGVSLGSESDTVVGSFFARDSAESGVGLLIAREILAAHGGSIEVGEKSMNEQSLGSSVWVRLPRALSASELN